MEVEAEQGGRNCRRKVFGKYMYGEMYYNGIAALNGESVSDLSDGGGFA